MGEEDYTHDDMAALHEECRAKIDLLQATIDYSGSNVQLIGELREKLTEREVALKAIEKLACEDFGFELEMWGHDEPDVTKRKCDVQLLAEAQRVIGTIYQIVHSEISNCSNPHIEWGQVKWQLMKEEKL